MKTYRLRYPLMYKGVHTPVGALVELTDAQASALGDKVELVRAPAAASATAANESDPGGKEPPIGLADEPADTDAPDAQATGGEPKKPTLIKR